MTASLFSFDPRLLLLVAARVTGVLFLAPGLSGRALPLKVRATLVTVVALALLPTQVGLWESSDASRAMSGLTTLPLFAACLCREAMLGLGLGFGVKLLVVGLRNVGQLASQAAGWGNSEGIETGDDPASPLARLLELTGIAVYFAVGGHRQLLGVLLESYAWFPLGDIELPSSLWASLLTLLTQTSEWVLRLSAPVLVATLSATLVAGLLQRALPQLETYTWASSANTLLVLAVLTFSAGAIGLLFPAELELAWETLRGGAAHG